MTLKELEQSLRRVVEKSLGGRFRGPVHPLEVARGLAHALVSDSQPGLVGQVAPNDFVVFLHPGEEAPFLAMGDSLQQELYHYLAAEARARDLRWVGPVRFRFAPAAQVDSGTFEVDARIESPATSSPLTWRDITLHTPVLTGVEGFVAGQTYTVRVPTCTLGRAEDCDVRIGDPRVSHHHARITWQDDRFILEDLGSRAGTWVNDERFSGARTLSSGDRIRLGYSSLRWDVPQS